MTLQQELAKIRNGELAPIYLVVGTEEYLKDLFRETLMKQVVAENDEMNVIRFDMETTYLSIALEEASTLPFFGDRRLVQIDKPFFLTVERNTSNLDHDLDELQRYLDNPLETTVLVIYAGYDKLDNRKKIVKALKKQATVISLEPMKENELKQYIKQIIDNEGFQITPEALERLLHLSNMDLSKVINELNKLFLYRLETKKISKIDVESLVAKSLEENIFEMVNYVMSKQPAKALSLHKELLLQGEDTIKINAILIQHFRLLIQIKVMEKMGYQQSNMTDVLKIHPYRVKLANQQVKKYQLTELTKIFDELVTNDWKIKTGQMNKELLFELFILKYGTR